MKEGQHVSVNGVRGIVEICSLRQLVIKPHSNKADLGLGKGVPIVIKMDEVSVGYANIFP